LRITALD